MQLRDLIFLLHLSFCRDCNRTVLTFASSIGYSSLLSYRQLLLVLFHIAVNVDEATS